MPDPRPARSSESPPHQVEPATDPQVTKSSSTHSKVEGEVAPRLPHEHDESSDSASRPPDPVIEQAAKDVESGKQPTDRGEVTNTLYNQTLRSPKGSPEKGG